MPANTPSTRTNMVNIHMSMAAVNLLRALWLSGHASRELAQNNDGIIIEHERQG